MITTSPNGLTLDRIDYYRQTEYYKDGTEVSVAPAQWIGSQAMIDALGMDQGWTDSDFVSLSKGFDKKGNALVQNAGEVDRSVGMDYTFSADKSTSILLSILETEEERQAIIDVHRNAVEKAFNQVFTPEATGRRVREGKTFNEEAEMVASVFTHFGSREGDPQLHSHVIGMNLAMREDGTFGALDQRAMMKKLMLASAYYRAEEAMGLKQLGYNIDKYVERDAFDRETGDIFYRIAGINDEWRKEFSKRREQILQYQKEHGGSKQIATLATRKAKDEPTYDEMRDIWARAYNDLRDKGIAKTVQEIRATQGMAQGISDGELIDKLREYNDYFQQDKIKERILLENIGRMGGEQGLQEADRFITELQASHQLGHNKRGYFSYRTVREQQKIVDLAVEAMDDMSAIVDQTKIAQGIETYQEEAGFTISQEQRLAVEYVTGNSGRIANIKGRAGTGKTTVCKAIADIYTSDGRTLIGVSTGWDAAKKLEAETGIKSYSALSLIHQLKDGKIKLDSNSVIVLDEAGMAGTKTVLSILEHMNTAEAKGAKLVMMGDEMQIQAVEAGSPFRLVAQHTGSTELTEIRRQKKQRDLDTANHFYTDALKAFDNMMANGQIIITDSEKEAREAIQKIYFTSPHEKRERLFLASTNKGVKFITSGIREGLSERGQLTGEEHTFLCKTTKHEEKIQLKAGDTIRFTEKNKDMDVYNGTQAVIKEINGTTITAAIQSDIKKQDGRMVSWDMEKFNSLNNSFAMTYHKSQGQGRNLTVNYIDSPNMIDRHMGLVGMTRAKEDVYVVGTKENIEKYRERIQVLAFKENAIDLAGGQRYQEASQLSQAKKDQQEQSKQEEQQRKSMMDRLKSMMGQLRDRFTIQHPQRGNEMEI